MDNAPITVIITTYNDYEYLEAAICSVVEQRLPPRELIVIDDGSEKYDAERITTKYFNNKKNIKVSFFWKKNGGASSARNFGLQKASQKYIAFLDVDDKMLPDNLFDKLAIIEELDDRYFGVYGGSIKSTGGQEVFRNVDGVIDPDLVDVEREGIPGGAPFYLFKKNILLKIGGFDEKIECHEDYDILIRLLKDNRRCKGSTSAGFYRNLRANSLSRPSDHLKHFSRIMVFLDKAERYGFYSCELLNQRRMAAYFHLAKGFLLSKRYVEAFKSARKGFRYSKPITKNQKLVYFFTFSFL